MQFTTVFTIIAAAMAVSAAPAPWSGGEGGSSSACSVGTSVSCCNTDNSGSSGILTNVLGGSCTLNLLTDLLGSSCDGGNTYCCPVNQSGLIDVGLTCTPINL